MLCRYVARKMATIEGRLFGLDVNKGYCYDQYLKDASWR